MFLGSPKSRYGHFFNIRLEISSPKLAKTKTNAVNDQELIAKHFTSLLGLIGDTLRADVSFSAAHDTWFPFLHNKTGTGIMDLITAMCIDVYCFISCGACLKYVQQSCGCNSSRGMGADTFYGSPDFRSLLLKDL